ncbi:MAG: FecR domain-containing protein [Anaeromyxobacter sp.]|nr:FecR domain-containing protein [Anaeromyxobacter sp.]MBL0274868.1 FecR domain-containing protein [Anaeromyxobacter sp.]
MTPHRHIPPEVRAEAARRVALRAGEARGGPADLALAGWLTQDPTHLEAFREAEAVWGELGRLREVAGPHLAEARREVAEVRLRRRRLAGGGLLAGAVAALLAVGWFLDPLATLDDRTYRTARGQRLVVALADGSRLELDTDTAVRVHASRRLREATLLRGQALFTVAHGDPRPFDVLAGDGRIRDVGTQFNVRLQGDRVAVTVLEGAVDVRAGPGDDQATRLVEGSRLSYGPSGPAGPAERVEAASTAAWRQGRLDFTGRSLGEVLAELGRYHDAALTVSSAGILELRVSGAFPTDDLPLTLRTIAATLPVQVRQTGPQAFRLDPR